MLTVDKSEIGTVIIINGNAPSILQELTILVEAVQEELKGKVDVARVLNDPIQKLLARTYLEVMRKKQQPNKGRQNGN